MSANSGPESQKNSKASETPTGAGAPTSKRRRRLAQAGLTTPVLMTVFSRPAVARHCTISAKLSGNPTPQPDVCRGLSPGFYYQDALRRDAVNWPSGADPNDPFLGVFSPIGGCVPDITLFDGMDPNLDKRDDLSPPVADTLKRAIAHSVAAYLNSLTFTPDEFGLTTAQVIDFVNSNLCADPAFTRETLALLNNRE